MDKIENQIKENLNYEIKTSSQDILRQYNLRNASKSKKAFSINFKYLFGGLGLGLAAFIGIISIVSNNQNSNNPDTPVIPVIDNGKKLEGLSVAQIEEYNDVALEMSSAVEIINSINSTAEVYADESVISTEELIENSFIESLNIVKSTYNPSISSEVYEASYTTTLKGKEVTLDYLMVFGEEYKFYFNSDLSKHDSAKEEITGELVINDSKYRVSGIKNIEVNESNVEQLVLDFQIFLDEETGHYLWFDRISGEENKFEYTLSLNKVQYYSILINNISDTEFKAVIMNKNITTDENTLKYIDEITYTITVGDDSWDVSYISNDKSSINGNFIVEI